jgi:maltooligosyltrehalose trehalohydrolase
VWAPAAQKVELVVEDHDGRTLEFPLAAEGTGYYSGFASGAEAGTRYRFRLDGAEAFPDPASRYQPEGPHGPSVVIDPHHYRWRDADWKGLSIEGQVISEIHVGTFSPEGTFGGVAAHLSDLKDAGITVLEIMPVAEFAGSFGWGYDGVNLFAPYHHYGTPDDLRRLVDEAHAIGLGVILDVVYNHFGPDGNYLPRFSTTYFSKGRTDWGDAINFDGEDSQFVREYFITNARYWIEEFHFDGLRLDATQQIFDSSPTNILTEVGAAVREAANGKGTIIVAENEPQRSTLVRPTEQGGSALDGLWNDDFHHAARVALVGRDEAYLSGYRGTAQEFISAAKYGFLYQGQSYPWQKQRRGISSLDIAPKHLIIFIQNHDQIANAGPGRRIHMETSPGRYRAMLTLTLLLPNTPMLFQGQEFCASQPFVYFADHTPDLARLVREGRAREMMQFPSIASDEGISHVPSPSSESNFKRCKIDWSERETNTMALRLTKDLLALRRRDPVISAQRQRALDGAVLTESAFVLRFFGDPHHDRLLIVNFGARIHASPIAEPLVAPPRGCAWKPVFSTESPKYGGWGTPRLETIDDGWWIPPECAVLLIPTDAIATTSTR